MSRGKTDAIFILHRWLWGILFLGVWLGGIPDRAVSAEDNDSRTWRTIAELSEEELARLDFSTDAPRHAGFPYMPAEPYPFKPPYTAEEIGYRIMEFPHMPRWDCVQIEDSGTLTPTGYLFINQIITLIHHRAPEGLVGQLTAKPGEVYSRWLAQDVAPPGKSRQPTAVHHVPYGPADHKKGRRVRLFSNPAQSAPFPPTPSSGQIPQPTHGL